MKKLLIFSVCILSICFGVSNANDQHVITPEVTELKMIQTNTEESIPKYLYKIVSPEEWQESRGKEFIKTSSMDKDFVHLATKDQVPHIAQKFWDKKDYIILKLDSKKLIGHLVYETNPGGATRYIIFMKEKSRLMPS